MNNKTLYALLLTLVNSFDAYDVLADNGFDPHETSPTVEMTEGEVATVFASLDVLPHCPFL